MNFQITVPVMFLVFSTAYGAGFLHPGSTLQDSSPHGVHHDHSVAFSVGLTRSMKVAHSEIIVFNKVFTNVGYGYDAISGIFTAPVTGLYVFHLHAYDSNTDVAMWLELMHDGKYVVSISGYNSHSSAGNSVILYMHKGETVFMKARPNQQFTLFGQGDEIYSTFMGYLLSPATD